MDLNFHSMNFHFSSNKFTFQTIFHRFTLIFLKFFHFFHKMVWNFSTVKVGIFLPGKINPLTLTSQYIGAEGSALFAFNLLLIYISNLHKLFKNQIINFLFNFLLFPSKSFRCLLSNIALHFITHFIEHCSPNDLRLHFKRPLFFPPQNKSHQKELIQIDLQKVKIFT